MNKLMIYKISDWECIFVGDLLYLCSIKWHCVVLVIVVVVVLLMKKNKNKNKKLKSLSVCVAMRGSV